MMSTKPPDEPVPDNSGSTATKEAEQPRRRGRFPRRLIFGALITALVTVGVIALLVNIMERKQEGQDVAFKVVEITDNTVDPAVWGQNFPIQYDLYKRTVDQTRTKHGGSEAIPNNPSSTDPRDTVSQNKLVEDPRLVTMWAGYPFAVDFREERGHAYMLIDQRDTRRVTEFKQPGACLNCHASTYVFMKELGNGDLNAGFAAMNKMTYADATKGVDHPVACIDCHNPADMSLRITRPAFIEGIKAAKADQGIQNYDVNRDASAQEKRAYVCAQCHVEYYFKGDGKTLTFPWQKGLTVQDAYAYYEEVGFKDFTHQITGANVLKAQHPEFETWSQGVHAKSGVTCADCHMPYMREGGAKVSDHQVRSPMLNVNRACQTCHNVSETELKDRVDQIQTRFLAARDVSWNALIQLIGDIDAAQKAGVPVETLDVARNFQRKAQYFIDYVEAENSAGFHAPGYELSVLNEATDAARLGQLALAGKLPAGVNAPGKAGNAPAPTATPTPTVPGPTLGPTTPGTASPTP